MKDKKLLIAALLLPVTVLFSGAAFAAGLQPTDTAAGVPTVQAIEEQTCIDIPIDIVLQGADAQNDIVLYQLTEQPRLGTAAINGNVLTYTPGKKTGKDVFSYTAADASGNTARPASLTVRVTKNRAGLTYADMEGDAAHYAALRLAQAKVMTGEQIGGCYFFRPTQTVSRSEFIAMAAAVADLPIEQTAQTDFVDDSGLSAWAKPFISAAASDGLVSGYQTASGLAEIRGQNPITLAEACTVLSNLLSDLPEGTAYVSYDEHAADMDWASRAVSNMERLDILPDQSNAQPSNTPITRRTACELIYRTMVLMENA